MKPLDEQLAVYASYHRNRWNRLTHYVGVPLLTFALLVPLSWLRVPFAAVELTAAMVFAVVVLVWYFRLDAGLAAAMIVAVAPLLYAADRVAQLPIATGLWVFGAAFVVGWAFQLAGHVFEGRRPALVDNLLQALVAPLFILLEGLFALGLRRDVQRRVEDRRVASLQPRRGHP
jgi:uncharacterized membrane protein YGL010W